MPWRRGRGKDRQQLPTAPPRFASKLIGEREVLREQVANSCSGGPLVASAHPCVSTNTHDVTESAVLPSEIEKLPDLSE
jgi:hypothetical protein